MASIGWEFTLKNGMQGGMTLEVYINPAGTDAEIEETAEEDATEEMWAEARLEAAAFSKRLIPLIEAYLASQQVEIEMEPNLEALEHS